MHVGIPCMKCSLHPSQQTNSRTGKASKTCGVGSAWREMADERVGVDPTIDKSLTENNIWMVGSPEDDVEAIVRKEIEEINQDKKSHGKRALRKDTVSVIEVIEKPPVDFMQSEDMSDVSREKFLRDSHEVMTDLVRQWNADWRIIEAVQHHDEFGGQSPHNHELIMITSHDKDGVKTMNCKAEYGRNFFVHLNENYPRSMREKGWNVEDVRSYDSLTEEEKEYRKQHPEARPGVDATVYKYKKLKENEKMLQEIRQQHQDLEVKITRSKAVLRDTQQSTQETLSAGIAARQVIEDSEQQKQIVELKKQSIERREREIAQYTGSGNYASYRAVQDENRALREELSVKDKIIQQLQKEKSRLQENVDIWKQRFTKVAKAVGRKMLNTFGIEVDDQSIQYYPSAEVKTEVDDSVRQLKQMDPDLLRVIPDNRNDGQYALTIRQRDGSYKKLADGFESREDAERYRREVTEAKKDLDEDYDRNIAKERSIS